MREYLTFCDERSENMSWKRYWCVLQGYVLSYWRYPEDEDQKQCLGSISLKQCVNPTLEPVPVEVCPRPHTFLMLSVPSKGKTQVRINYLLHRNHETLERNATRLLLSADSKDDLRSWLSCMNGVLKSVRSWESDALQPIDSSLMARLSK
jgi:actin-binding protein anillin